MSQTSYKGTVNEGNPFTNPIKINPSFLTVPAGHPLLPPAHPWVQPGVHCPSSGPGIPHPYRSYLAGHILLLLPGGGLEQDKLLGGGGHVQHVG